MQWRPFTASLALALPLLAGCHSDEAVRPTAAAFGDGLLDRYVAMGNSITAGLQSAGINDSTQLESYAVLFAGQANAQFYAPLLASPGCPAPLDNNVQQTRVGGAGPTDCALRSGRRIPYLSNVAVPNAGVADLLSNFGESSNPNALTTFILGGRTQLQAALEADPTFVSVWIGNNDVLGAFTNSANPGDPALITSQADFEAAYGEVLDSLEARGVGAALIGVADVTATPFASLGAIYWCLKNGGCPAPLPPADPMVQLNPLFTVDDSCAPEPFGIGLQTLVPWTKGVVALLGSFQGAPGNIDCTDDAQVVTGTELAALQAATGGFNAFIAQQAQARGFVYLDVNPTLAAFRATGEVPAFPDLSQVVANPADPGPVTFGPIFTLDGVHPSGEAHRVVADSLISAVNRFYELDPAIPFIGED